MKSLGWNCWPDPSLTARRPSGITLPIPRWAQRQLGHRLVSVLRIEDDLLCSARIYSSQGGHLATQARKCLDDAPQMRKVIAARKPLLVDGEPAVRAAFSDHERILSLGCASVQNIPILIAGTPKANVNLLHVAGHFAGPSQARNIRMAHIACQMCAPLYTSPRATYR